MKVGVTKLENSKCPLCSKPLASNEYQKAITELENKLEKNFEKEYKKNQLEFEKQIKELKSHHEDDIKRQKQLFEEQLESIKNQLTESKKEEIDYLKKQYETMTKEGKKHFEELQKQLKINHKNELQERDKQIKELEKSQKKFKEQAYEKAKFDYEIKLKKKTDEIDERELQVQRLKEKIDDLNKQLEKSQSELQGELGELNLYETLTNAFPEDHFDRQKRGQQSGDIIQTIRTPSGKLDTQIIYDNKENTKITSNDLKKAKQYQKIHNTKYVLIVSTIIPKSYANNGIYGIKEGVLMINPKIIIEVATRCRDNIIEISRISKGKKDRESKESKLFDYVISQEFTTIMASIYEINDKMRKLQDQEERTHTRWWKDRKMYRDQLIKSYMDIQAGVDSITQKETLVEV